jgi:hypothetical protein
MKELADIVYDPAAVRRELTAFQRLLETKPSLSEQDDILPFFRKRRQLSAFIGTFSPDLGPAPQLGFEFPFLGDFAADIVLGDRARGEFCVVELEDDRPESIFTRAGKKATREWSRRFDHGFSQLVDWFYALDDLKRTERFTRDFGHGHVKFFGLLVIGRSAGLSESERSRLRWRTEKVRVNSHAISCLTFEDLHDYLTQRINFYPDVSRPGR